MISRKEVTPELANLRWLFLRTGDLGFFQNGELLASILSNFINGYTEVQEKSKSMLDSTVSQHYDSLSKWNQLHPSDENYLTFGIFTQKNSSFSWILTFNQPDMYSGNAQIALQSQIELRNILFKKIEFSSITKVLDFGCGYASDIIQLGNTYSHLQLTGYTISAKQAEIGNQKIQDYHLQERIKVYNRNSAIHPFSDQFDLILGLEVAVYVKEKHDLFLNISSHLHEGGTLVLAELISQIGGSIEHQETSAYIINAQEWNDLFSGNNLKIIECIEVSQEIANFLHDPKFDENLSQLDNGSLDAVVRTHFEAWNMLGIILEDKIVSYVLLTLQKDSFLSQEEIFAINEKQLSSPIPYSAI